jgi:hypothetical protein
MRTIKQICQIVDGTGKLRSVHFHMCALVLFQPERVLNVEFCGESCTVPNDSYIRLAYYLKCVHGTSCPESIPDAFRSWESMNAYDYRSTDELREMLYWSNQYSPGTIKGKGYFIMVEPNTLTSSNKFVKVTATIIQRGILRIHDDIVAFVRQTSISVEIMVYEERWEDVYYYDARNAISRQISNRESPPAPSRSGPCSVF